MTASSEHAAPPGARPDAFDVFLSHNSRDKPAVERIARRLRDMGVRPWLDAWHLAPGSSWQTALEEGLVGCGACAVFVGPSGIGDWAREELHVALDRAAKDPAFRLVPVLLPGLPDPLPEGLLPPFLTNRTWVDLRAGVEMTQGLQALANAIKGVPNSDAVLVHTASGTPPYLGLRPFDVDDAHLFFGRDAETQRLIELLKGTSLLTIVGSSGSGKSSLVRAGLVPALRGGALPRSERWLVRILRPGGRPLDAVAAELAALGRSQSMQATVDQLAEDPRSLSLASSLILADRPEAERVVWVVDQFEELFTLCTDEGQRGAFVRNLLYAGTIPGGPTTVVLTLRADFYGHCATYPDLARYVATHQFLVSPMGAEDLRRAIEQPALAAGLEFEEGLVDVILDDVAGQPGALPLLEHALFELWQRRLGAMLTLQGYRDSGGVSGAVANRADAIYASLAADQQQVMRNAILRLTQPGEATEATRRRARWSELDSAARDRDAFERIIAQLIEARLVITSGTVPGDRWVDVSHEALIRAWPRLKSWIEEDHASLVIHRRMTEAAQDWQRLDRDDGALYRGARLDEVLAWRASRDVPLSDLETAFVEASVAARQAQHQAAEDQRRRELEDARAIARGQRRAARLLGVVAAVLLLGLGVSAYMTVRVVRARAVAESRGLAWAARAELGDDPELSLLLGRDAWRRSPTDQAGQTLRDALIASAVRVRFDGSSRLNVADFDPQGVHAVAAAVDGSVWIWDPSTGAVEHRLVGHRGAVRSAAFSPDGRALVTAGADGTAIVWDATTGRRRAVLRGHDAPLRSARFSSDGALVVTASDDGTAAVSRSDTGERLAALRVHDDVVATAAFVPGDEMVVTASFDDTGRIWRWRSNEVLAILDGHTKRLRDAVVSPDGTLIATASDDGTARMWSVASGAPRGTLAGSAGRVIRAVFSPQGDLLVTTDTEGTVWVWEVESGRPLRELAGHVGFVTDAAFTTDGSRLVTTGADASVRVWDMSRWSRDGLLRVRGDAVLTLAGHDLAVSTARFSPDGRVVLSAGFDGTARVWSTTGEHGTVLREPGTVRAAALSPDGTLVATAGDDGTPRLWEASTGRPTRVLDGDDRPVRTVIFAPDGRLLVTGSEDGVARMFDVETGREVHALVGRGGAVTDATFSPDGTVLVTATEQGTLDAWDVETGAHLDGSTGHDGPITAVQFAGDGATVATGGEDGLALVWDLDPRDGLRRRTSVGHGNAIRDLAFTPSADSLLTVGRDSDAQLWSTADGRRLAVFAGGQGTMNAVDISPDGSRAVLAGSSGDAWIYQLVDGALVSTLHGHGDEVVTARYSPDGGSVLTASLDGSARVWDATTGRPQSIMRTTARGLIDAVFDPTGRRVLTTGPRATAWLFTCRLCAPDDDLFAVAGRRVTRDLSAAERRTYLR